MTIPFPISRWAIPLRAAIRLAVCLAFAVLFAGCRSTASPATPGAITDDLGSVIAATDRAGAVVERYAYDDFGSPTIYAPDGTTVRTHSLIDNDVLFAGARWHAELGLYWMRYRWYDPATGRFLTQDPIGLWGDPFNLGNGMAYVGHSPGTWVDPFGLYGCSPDIYEWHHGITQDLLNHDWFLAAMGVDGKPGSYTVEDLRDIIDQPEFGLMVPQLQHRGEAPSLHYSPSGKEAWNAFVKRHLDERIRLNGKLAVDDLRDVFRIASQNEPYFTNLLAIGYSEKATMSYRDWKALCSEDKTKESARIRERVIKARKAVQESTAKTTTATRSPGKGRKVLAKTIVRVGGAFFVVGKVFAVDHVANGFNEGGLEEGLTRSLPLMEELRDGLVLVGTDGFDSLEGSVVESLPEDILNKVGVR